MEPATAVEHCLVAFGSNLGDSRQVLANCHQRLIQQTGISNLSASGPVVTRPVGGSPNQRPYLNACFRFQTTLIARSVIDVLATIETETGRQREQRWESRTIDLDLLLYGEQQVEEPNLVVPHPRMSFRRFVLVPAAQIAPDWVHADSGLTIADLVRHLDHRPNQLVFAAPADKGSDAIASVIQPICQRAGWQFFWARNLETWQKIERSCKFMVYIRDSESELAGRARGFRGATLGLENRHVASAQMEIRAAITAMDEENILAS